MVFELSNGIVPSISGDVIRSEKNYSIVVFEKLSQTAMAAGMDITEAYRSRDRFIRKNELMTSLDEVLQVRDAAIVFFTKEVGKTNFKQLSPLTLSVVQYIGLNLYQRLTVKELASHFFISETKLQSIFKKEMGMTIYSYISERKIEEAKIMLNFNRSINEIALSLGFSDSSHLSKVFKKHVGISPKQYQQEKNHNQK